MGLFSRTPSKDATDTSSISFTALYTGYVWYRNGLSAEAFRTDKGALYYALMWPFEAIGWQLLNASVKHFLLHRHYLMDSIISRAIEQEGVTQVLEIACGLSPRGWRYTQKYPQLKYVEADLPGMATRKQRLLQQLDNHPALGKTHFVTTCNILADGDDSLANVIAREFDTSKPLLVITEGLVNYFDLETVTGFWKRLDNELKKFPKGIYLTDNYPLLDSNPIRKLMKFSGDTLGVVSRSSFTFHFNSDEAMAQHFRGIGYRQAIVHNPGDHYDTLPIPRTRGDSLVRVLEARA